VPVGGNDVGKTVGLSLGTSVGVSVGVVDGAVVGSPLGIVVGATVVALTAVGGTDGEADGNSVGAKLGIVVVGSTDGATEGEVVGSVVGIAIGEAVGCVVGAEVGESVYVPRTARTDSNFMPSLMTTISRPSSLFNSSTTSRASFSVTDPAAKSTCKMTEPDTRAIEWTSLRLSGVAAAANRSSNAATPLLRRSSLCSWLNSFKLPSKNTLTRTFAPWTDGANVGLAVGDVVGLTYGCVVGLEEGADVGEGVDGDNVSATGVVVVGDDDGAAVGAPSTSPPPDSPPPLPLPSWHGKSSLPSQGRVGWAVVGWAEGARLGAKVGVTLGATVGVAVGASDDGDAVGSPVGRSKAVVVVEEVDDDDGRVTRAWKSVVDVVETEVVDDDDGVDDEDGDVVVVDSVVVAGLNFVGASVGAVQWPGVNT
jgi:hypothetical protein